MTPPAVLSIEDDLPFLPGGFEHKYKEPFVYALQLGTIAAGASGVGQIVVDSGSYFCVTHQAAVISATDFTSKLDPKDAPFRVFMKASSSAVAYQNTNNGVAIGGWFGTSEQPHYWLKRGLLWKAGDQIDFTVRSQLAAGGTDYDVELVFAGFKVFLNFADSVDTTPRA